MKTKREKKYRAFGLLPMTKEQTIAYMQSCNFLTKLSHGNGYVLTGGIRPTIDEKTKKLKYYRGEVYNGYEHAFNRMCKTGEIEEAYAPM